MTRQAQGSLFKREIIKNFGGSRLKSNPKTKRPLSTKNAIHLVLKSGQVMGARSMLHYNHANKIAKLIERASKAHGIRLYHFVNVGNHLHLVIKLQHRDDFTPFIRALTGVIARMVLKAERGAAKNIQFWLARPFTRIITWGPDYNRVCAYMKKNIRQARFIAWGFDILDPASIAKLSTT